MSGTGALRVSWTTASHQRFFSLVEIVEPLDDDALASLAILAEHVADIEPAADLAMVAGLLDAEAGQHMGIGERSLAEFHQADVGSAAVGDDLLNGLGAGLGPQTAEGDLRVSDDGRQHARENLGANRETDMQFGSWG